MNVYTFIVCILFTSVSNYKIVVARSTYDNPSYNDRDENLLSSHQKKRLTNEEALQEEQEYERSAPVYEAQRFRKFEPDPGFARHDNRELADFEESKINMQKRGDYYEAPNSPKDASIEVILDPRAKKAVAVVENSPNGQAMYDLTGWKNKDENSAYDADQFTPGTQEQVVNLVYPAERNERKYSSNSFDSNSDYSDKAKGGFKAKLMENEAVAAEETHKRKRNVDLKTKSETQEKRSTDDKSKRKSDQVLTSDVKQSKECPPHNTPATSEVESNKDNTNTNENKYDKQQTVKREVPQWSQDQISALKSSLSHFKDSSEVQNLRTILSSMGLIDEELNEKKRETAKSTTDTKTPEKREEKEKVTNDIKADTEDEDLDQDNLILKRNGREVTNEEVDVNSAPQEPIDKRETDENQSEEEESEEIFDEKKDVKRSNSESEVAEAKEEINNKEEAQARKKRQDSENNKAESSAEKINESPAPESEISKNDNAKKYVKRETADSSKELRKNRDNQETEEEYERRMENQIQAKIDAIKEKVKREILAEQLNKRRYKRNYNNEYDSLNTNIRKRRQTKEQAKEETAKVVQESESSNKENIVENPESQAKNVRRKRANSLPEKQMVYRGYQDQDEDAEEDGEFDDNSYDGRMYIEKRQAEDENDYYDPVRKREVENYLRQYFPEQRNRRSFTEGFAEDSSNAFHGSRRALKNKSFNGRENQEEYNAKSNENNDNEYFGSLPQSYNGDLTRYKRVKRDNPYK